MSQDLLTKEEILSIAQKGMKKDIAKKVTNSKQYFAISGQLPKKFCTNLEKFKSKIIFKGGIIITGGTFPIVWLGINASKKSGVVVDFDKWFMWKYGDWDVKEIEAKFIKYLNNPDNFGKGGKVEETVADWIETNSEKILNYYLPDVKHNQIFSQNELKNEGDYVIDKETAGDKSEQAFIEICFGEKFDKAIAEISDNYSSYMKYAEDISDGSLLLDVQVLTDKSTKSVMFLFTDASTSEYKHKQGGEDEEFNDVSTVISDIKNKRFKKVFATGGETLTLEKARVLYEPLSPTKITPEDLPKLQKLRNDFILKYELLSKLPRNRQEPAYLKLFSKHAQSVRLVLWHKPEYRMSMNKKGGAIADLDVRGEIKKLKEEAKKYNKEQKAIWDDSLAKAKKWITDKSTDQDVAEGVNWYYGSELKATDINSTHFELYALLEGLHAAQKHEEFWGEKWKKGGDVKKLWLQDAKGKFGKGGDVELLTGFSLFLDSSDLKSHTAKAEKYLEEIGLSDREKLKLLVGFSRFLETEGSGLTLHTERAEAFLNPKFKEGSVVKEEKHLRGTLDTSYGKMYDMRLPLGSGTIKDALAEKMRDIFYQNNGSISKPIMDRTIKILNEKQPKLHWDKLWKEYYKLYDIQTDGDEYDNPFHIIFKEGGDVEEKLNKELMETGGELSTWSYETHKPKFGINGSDKWMAIVYKDGVIEENEYFDSDKKANDWCEVYINSAKGVGDIVEELTSEFSFKTGGKIKEKVYDKLWITLKQQGKSWEELPQHPLENKTWKQAVNRVKELAQSEKVEIRLSMTEGYNNQGHYFHPNETETRSPIVIKDFSKGQGHYATGGSIKNQDIKVGEKFKLPNEEVIEIKRLFTENIDEEWVEYTRNGEKQENSVKSLRIFLNNWKGQKFATGGDVPRYAETNIVYRKLNGVGEKGKVVDVITSTIFGGGNRHDYMVSYENQKYGMNREAENWLFPTKEEAEAGYSPKELWGTFKEGGEAEVAEPKTIVDFKAGTPVRFNIGTRILPKYVRGYIANVWSDRITIRDYNDKMFTFAKPVSSFDVKVSNVYNEETKKLIYVEEFEQMLGCKPNSPYQYFGGKKYFRAKFTNYYVLIK